MQRVLFIDRSNSISSPMAEAWFNRMAGRYGKASSCGLWPAEWTDACAVQAMYQVGIEIGDKLPRKLEPRLLAQADIVILMGVQITASDLPQTRIWQIVEPLSPPLDQISAHRDQILKRVDELIAEIRRHEQAVALSDKQFRTVTQELLSI